MRPAFFALVLLLTSCGLFKPKPKSPIPGPGQTAFQTISYPAIHQALYLDYTLVQDKEESELTVYPYSDKGYEFDYAIPGYKGYVRISENARKNSRKYRNYFKDSMLLHEESSLWLSEINFNELLHTGSTRMNFGSDSSVTFDVKGTSEYKMLLQDTVFRFQTIEIVAREKPYYISFLPDPEYPLIVKQVLHISIELASVQNRAPEYNKFVPGPGCVLKYRMTERYTEEYNIHLTNTVWTDTLIRFRLRGSYAGAEYSYDFDYDVVYKNKAILNPDFMLPVFSAIKGEMEEDSFNWFLLRKDAMNEILIKKRGYIDIPRYVENPEDDPEAYEDTASFNEAKREYQNSYHTWFELERYGRLGHTDYLFYGEDTYDEQLLPSLRFYSPETGLELEVLDRGKFPLLLYFNDGEGSVEINLLYAGPPEE